MLKLLLLLALVLSVTAPSAHAQEPAPSPTQHAARTSLISLPPELSDFWNREIFSTESGVLKAGDLIESAATLVILFLLGAAVRGSVKRSILPVLTSRAERTTSLRDGLPLIALRATRFFPFAVLVLYAATLPLPLPPLAQTLCRAAAVIAGVAQLAIWGDSMLDFGLDHTKKRRIQADPSSVTALGAFSFFGKLVLWAMLILLAVQMLGLSKYLTPLIAGIGIGGVAVAFALQKILSDIFCSVAILLDKPFVVGDFIVAGEHMGTIESIGIKTTRVRSLFGEEIIFPNADLVGCRIRNFKRMRERRALFSIGVTYATSSEKLQKIPQMIRSIIESKPKARFDRAHFQKYGDSALVFEIVYYVRDPDYNLYMDLQQAINLEIFSAFAKEGIEFAQPTQAVLMRGQNGAAGFMGTETAPAAGKNN